MQLMLVDAGNARLKWAQRDGQVIGKVDFANYRDNPEKAVAELCGLAADVEAIAVSNVAGRNFADLLRRSLEPKYDGLLWFARSTAMAGGVRNAYSTPANLGVDRWAAIVGAYGRQQMLGGFAPLCVVDAGTAVTIDAVEPDGTHLGGLILPGLALQRAALLESTADISEKAAAQRDPDAALSVFATDTASAIARSGAVACAATIDRCVRQLSSGSRQPVLMLTGGDANAVAPWLATAFEICPNLVLEGLAVLFEQRSSV
jgi:type III pantothenate kinase